MWHLSNRKQFIRLSLYTGLQSSIRLLVNFVLGKMAAIYLGTAGFGLLGQFQNIGHLFQSLSNGAIQNGVIKYIASEEPINYKKRLIQTAFSLSAVLGLLAGVIVFVFHTWINDCFLGLEHPLLPFLALSISCIFFSLNLLLTSIFNGSKDFKNLAYFNIVQSITMLVLFLVLTHYQGLNGALIGIVSFSIFSFSLGLIVFKKKYSFYFSNFRFGFDRQVLKNLSGFSLMALATILSYSFSQLWVRTHLINVVSLDAAGLWEGLNRISNFYTFFLAMIFSSYILPKYSQAKNGKEILGQMKSNFVFIAGLTALILILIYLLRSVLVQIVFTENFLPLNSVIHYHLAGDFLKIIAWLLTNMLVAQKQIILFVITDLIYHLSFMALTYLFVVSLEQVTIAYALSGMIYLIILAIAVYYFLRNKK